MKQIHAFEIGGGHGTRAIEFSPSGRYLARIGWHGTYVWDTETGKEINLIEKTGWAGYPVLLFAQFITVCSKLKWSKCLLKSTKVTKVSQKLKESYVIR